jgi:hypothetical protein
MKNTETVYQNKEHDIKVQSIHTLNHGDYLLVTHGDCTYIYGSSLELRLDDRCTMYSVLPTDIYNDMMYIVNQL